MRIHYITPTQEATRRWRRFDPGFDNRWSWDGPGYGHRACADVYRENDTYVVDIDLPGVGLEDIDIELEKNTLTVSAERPQREGEQCEMLVSGRPYGSFVRKFFLSDGLDVESIEASLDKGVLTLRIPMADESKARRIEIMSGGANHQIEG
ncbi:MAG: Hsp20/alpha crystallin family protein [Acidimicrobiia bacterium]|nr:Hsp20/alpha crystallin family protein [Acidimicrobiia bacterium]MDH3463853.1 Hsp20/alpha crystallin family protein [Acidimicrobiia bacterium]